MYEGLRELRERLLPQHVDRTPEDFAGLCRSEPGVWDFAQRLGAAIERFSVRCLTALRQKFLEDCGADHDHDHEYMVPDMVPDMVPASGPGTTEGGGLAGGGASPADAAAEVAKCVPRLAEEAALLRRWLERELPQEENSLGRRLLTVVENSLVSGLFVLYLRQGFAEFFHDAGDEEGGDPRSRAEAKGLATRRAAIVFAIEASLAASGLRWFRPEGRENRLPSPWTWCNAARRAGGGGAPLCACRAGRGTWEAGRLAGGDGWRRVAGRGGIPRRRRQSLSAFPHAERTAPMARQGHWTIRNWWSTSRASSLPCSVGTFQRRRGRAGYHRRGWACGLRRRFAASGEKAGSLFSRTWRFPSPRLRRGKPHGPHGGSPRRGSQPPSGPRAAVGQEHGAPAMSSLPGEAGRPVGRIQVRQGPGGVTLLALPTAAMAMSDDFAENVTWEQAIRQAHEQSPAQEVLLRAVEACWRAKGIAPDDYSLCVLQPLTPVEEPDEEAEDQRPWQRRVRRFLNQKARWPLKEAEEILNALGIVIEPKADGAPHGKVRLGDRHHTLSSKLLKDGQVFATYLGEWIRTLGQERRLADLLRRKDPRLAPYMRKADGGEE